MNTAHFHPMMVHFPIALIMVGFLADAIFIFYKKELCFSKTGLYLLILGTLAAIAAFATGHLFTFEPTEGAIVSIFEKHETMALVTIILLFLTSIFRVYAIIKTKEETNLKWVVLLLYFFSAISVSVTGFLGGSMVFDYMMGI